jgi:hypothetical protein
VLGLVSYYLSMLVVGAELRRAREVGPAGRLRSLCWIPYFTDGILAGVAGLLNPAGLFYVVASALPSTLGANAGLLSLPSMIRRLESKEPIGPIPRSFGWIASGAIVSLAFIVVIGRGLTWSR